MEWWIWLTVAIALVLASCAVSWWRAGRSEPSRSPLDANARTLTDRRDQKGFTYE